MPGDAGHFSFLGAESRADRRRGDSQTHVPPYKPMTQCKIERDRHSMKKAINLQKHWLPEELE